MLGFMAASSLGPVRRRCALRYVLSAGASVDWALGSNFGESVGFLCVCVFVCVCVRVCAWVCVGLWRRVRLLLYVDWSRRGCHRLSHTPGRRVVTAFTERQFIKRSTFSDYFFNRLVALEWFFSLSLDRTRLPSAPSWVEKAAGS